jgi:hypothetical protein
MMNKLFCQQTMRVHVRDACLSYKCVVGDAVCARDVRLPYKGVVGDPRGVPRPSRPVPPPVCHPVVPYRAVVRFGAGLFGSLAGKQWGVVSPVEGPGFMLLEHIMVH